MPRRAVTRPCVCDSSLLPAARGSCLSMTPLFLKLPHILLFIFPLLETQFPTIRGPGPDFACSLFFFAFIPLRLALCQNELCHRTFWNVAFVLRRAFSFHFLY